MRSPSQIDAIADAYTHELAQAHPTFATMLGFPGHDHLLEDASPAGYHADLARQQATLAKLDAATPVDAVDEVTVAAMRERLGIENELIEAHEYRADLNVIASPLQMRDIFDLMPTDTAEQWANIAARASAFGPYLQGYTECLREGIASDLMPARRQVVECLKQADELAGPTSFFATFLSDVTIDGTPASPGLAADLARGAADARAAYGELSQFLRDELLPVAPEDDAVGHERYQRFSRLFVGATIDLDETYEWGVEELARLTAEQEAVAAEIAGPGASVAEAVAKLNADPARRLHGTDALKAWMQETSDAAIRALDGVHFDIPEPLHTLECRIAPTNTGGIYYTGPSDDFSRPGRMWWSVPEGVTEFATWDEKTTVYHEGVPGHHLQVGQAAFNSAELNLWRRQVCWLSGHGEGWALYAERLMQEFGFMDDPGDRLGLIDGQRLRATRVVLDLGLHLRKPAFERYGGGTWDFDKCWALLRDNSQMQSDFLRFELNRYAGWPGQAPSYKVGQRLWEEIRDDARAAATARGEEFSLKDFHTRALNLGALPMDVLRDQLVR